MTEWPEVVIDVAEEASIHLTQSLRIALLTVKQYKYERANLSEELDLSSSSLQVRVTWCILNINTVLPRIFFQTLADWGILFLSWWLVLHWRRLKSRIHYILCGTFSLRSNLPVKLQPFPRYRICLFSLSYFWLFFMHVCGRQDYESN